MVKGHRLPLFQGMTFLFWFTMYVYVSGLTPYALDPAGIAATGAMAGLISGAYGFMQMALRFPAGLWSDRIGRRKPFIIAGVILSAISALGMYFSRSAAGLLIFRGLSGVAVVPWVMMTALYSSYYADGHAARSIGILTMYNNAGQVGAMLLGGVLLTHWGQKATFLVAVAIGLINTGLSFFIVERKGEAPNYQRMQLREVISGRRLWHVAFLAVLCQLVLFGTTFGFTPELATILGADGMQLGILSMLSVVPGIFASYLCSTPLPNRIGIHRMLLGSFLVMAVATALMPLCQSLGLLMALQVVSGLGRGMAFPLLMGQSITSVRPEQRASAMGLFQAVYGLGMFVGPVMVGVLRDLWGLTIGFFVVALISVLAGLLSWPLKQAEEA